MTRVKGRQFSSLQSLRCVRLYKPMNCSMPGLPVHYQPPDLPKLMSIRSVMWSKHLIFCSPLLLLSSIFPNIRVFSNESALHISGQNIGVSASTSVLPMNIQDWFPLGLTGLISLQSKGLSRVLSNTTVQSINSSVLSFLYSSNLTAIHVHWENHSFD